MGFDEVGFECDGGAEGGGGGGQFSLGLECEAEIALELGDVGAEGNGAGEQVCGDVVAAMLLREDAEEMEGVGVIGIDGDDLAVEVFGLGEVSGLMMLQALEEQGLEFGVGHG